MTGPSHCSFCGQTRADVKFMLAGPNVAICGECVALAVREMVEGKGQVIDADGFDDAPILEVSVFAAGLPALSGGEFVDLSGRDRKRDKGE